MTNSKFTGHNNRMFTVVPATKNHASFVSMIYMQNNENLHGNPISVSEWEALLSAEDPDEAHFIIYRHSVPVAWLKINGLLGGDTGWISMLVVSKEYHRQGIGTFAINYSEQYIYAKGITKIGIHITDDNIPATNLYQKCGYHIAAYNAYTTGDGKERMGYIFIKEE